MTEPKITEANLTDLDYRMAKIEDGKLSDFKPQAKNANKHTARGMKNLSEAYSEVGYVAPMTAVANGEMVDGSARLEQAYDQFDDNALVIRHDGKRPIIMVREDIKDADDPRAKKISYGANRIGQINLDWDPEVILADIESGVKLKGIFGDDELKDILGEFDIVDNPEKEWQGMPEFKQEDKTAFQSIHIHFKDKEAVQEFSKLIGQKITDKTRSLWFPEVEIERYSDKRYIDES